MRGRHLQTVPTPAWARNPRVRTLLVAAFLLFCYLSTCNMTHLQSTDTVSAAGAAWALAWLHSLNVPSAWAHDHALWWVPGVGGLTTNRFPGVVLAAVPFSLLTGPRFSYVAGALTAVATTTAALLLLRRLLQRHGHGHAATLGVLALGLGSSVWPTAASELWTHGPAMLCLAGALLAADRGRWLACGLWWGAAVMVRPHLAVAAAVFGVVVCAAGSDATRQRRVHLAALARIATGTLAGVVGYFGYRYAQFGHLTLMGGYAPTKPLGGGLLSLPGAVLGTLLTPARGVLIASPVLILCARRLRAAWRAAVPLERAAASSGVAYMLVTLVRERYSGGEGFTGNRLVCESLLLCTPLLLRAAELECVRSPAAARNVAWLTAAGVLTAGVEAFLPADLPIGDRYAWWHFYPLHLLLISPDSTITGLVVVGLLLFAIVRLYGLEAVVFARRDRALTPVSAADRFARLSRALGVAGGAALAVLTLAATYPASRRGTRVGVRLHRLRGGPAALPVVGPGRCELESVPRGRHARKQGVA